MSPKRALRISLAVVIGVLLCGASLAAGGEEHGGADHGGGLKELLTLIANFALIIGVIFYFARKPAQAFFRTRRDTVKGEIDAAGELLAEAERRNSEWQRKFSTLDAELDDIRSASRQRAEDERAQILAEAQEAAERIQRDAAVVAEQELLRARSQLREEVASIATELATRLVGEQMGDADRDRLIDEFITSVERSGANGASR